MSEKPIYLPRPERWPQFSVRGLLILIALSAAVMPWALFKYQYEVRLRAVLERVRAQET